MILQVPNLFFGETSPKGLEVAAAPIVFSTTPGRDIMIITGMRCTSSMFLALAQLGSEGSDLGGGGEG